MQRLALCVTLALLVVLAIPATSLAWTASVGVRDGNHLYMRWDMDTGGEIARPGTCVGAIEVGTAATVGSDGYFYDETSVRFELDDLDFTGCARQGEWVDASPIEPGTYYIHARYKRETTDDYYSWWGSVRTVTVSPPPNQPPRIDSASFWITQRDWAGTARPSFELDLTYCDDNAEGDLTLHVREQRLVNGIWGAARTTSYSLLPTDSCDYDSVSKRSALKWTKPTSRYHVSAWITDEQGAVSSSVSKTFARRAGIY